MANLVLKFLLEVAGLIALGYAGAAIGSGLWAPVLAVGFPSVAIAVWARWNAPRSAHRARTLIRVPLELAVFVTAGLGLFVADAATWAVAYLSLVVLNAALLTALRQWEA